MLVSIQTLRCIVFLEAVAFEVAEQRRFDRNLVLTDDEALTLAHRLVCLVPRMLLDLCCCEAFVRVSLKNFVDQVDTLR